MKLRVLNVGYGESILLTANKADGSAFTMLIDGGSGEDAEYAGFPARMRAADALKEALENAGLDTQLLVSSQESNAYGIQTMDGDGENIPEQEGFFASILSLLESLFH